MIKPPSYIASIMVKIAYLRAKKKSGILHPGFENIMDSNKSLLLLECEESLTDIVEGNEKTHPHKHGDVLLNGNSHATEQVPNKRLCNAVSDTVADGNVCDKSEYDAPIALFVSEGIVFIKKIAENTAEEVVGCRGKPVAEMETVIKHKHYCRTEQSVYAAHQYAFPERFVKKLLNHNNHLLFLSAYYNTDDRSSKHTWLPSTM